jgi:hypothetical protein
VLKFKSKEKKLSIKKPRIRYRNRRMQEISNCRARSSKRRNFRRKRGCRKSKEGGR